MAQYKLKRLRSFYKKLRDNGLVVEFDPNNSPVPGVSNRGGFALVEATPEELASGTLIRENEYSELTPEGREIWRFPSVVPWP
ncbi:hypothetical protein [Nocardia thailandica]|uniref:hypothetical protein n=1 Tax=Nocardia thailandica TaxID=257275 RepID=UPI000312FF7C|nr:hypothetical protein [Nocardia thailandica]